ncbi:MAG: hypothetical protein ACKV0T_01705 [Planctomycetales bacterium]
MQTIDFARSFLTFRLDMLKKPPQTVSHPPPYTLNNARIQLDCVCDIADRQTRQSHRFVLGASCKTERVGVPADIWTVPNSDFVPVVSPDQFLNIKTYAYIGQEESVTLYGQGRPQPDRQTGRTAEAFDSLRIHIQDAEGIDLATPQAIIAATYAHQPLVAQTEFQAPRYEVRLTYPVKTFNVNERDNIYQTDTGPVLFPDLTREPEELIESLELAYSAFNAPDWIEFLVRTPTPAPGGVMVHHYSRAIRWDGVRNRLFAIGPGGATAPSA